MAEPGNPLDRPVWHALDTRQAKLSHGGALARRMAPEYGIFAAAADFSPESLAALAALVPQGGQLALVENDTAMMPPGLTASPALCHQMIAERIAPADHAFGIVDLGAEDAARMLALASLTQPGPFFARTHQLGNFVGIEHHGKLVAMAGERMKPPGYTEVSGVCTHPDHRGHGYATALTRLVATRILARGDLPILHVYASRNRAIALYESLGFVLRRPITMTFLTRV